MLVRMIVAAIAVGLVGMTATSATAARKLTKKQAWHATRDAARQASSETDGMNSYSADRTDCRRRSAWTIDCTYRLYSAAQPSTVGTICVGHARVTRKSRRIKWRYTDRPRCDWHAPPPAPAGRTRDTPIAIGSPFNIGSWQLTILGVTPNATAAVMAENPYNTPPAMGTQFFMAAVRATYTGSASATMLNTPLAAVGNSAVEYTTFSPGCGVIPSELPVFTEVFTGGTIEGNVCWQIRSTDAESLVAYATDRASGRRVFAALQP